MLALPKGSRFYDEHDYVYVDLKLRRDRRVALLSLGYVTQGRSTR